MESKVDALHRPRKGSLELPVPEDYSKIHSGAIGSELKQGAQSALIRGEALHAGAPLPDYGRSVR